MAISEIRFYHQNAPFGFLSNFSPHGIFLRQKIWPTAEHFFQAQKFAGTTLEEQIRRATTPSQAKAYGRSAKHTIRTDWRDCRVYVMKDALWAKFTQHPDLQEMLLATGQSILIEHTKHDNFWGNSGDDTGENMLGRLLMDVRRELGH